MQKQEIKDYLTQHFGIPGDAKTDRLVDSWIELASRSGLDIGLQLAKANSWLLTATKRYRRLDKFLNNWMIRSAEPRSFEPHGEKAFFSFDRKE